MKEIYRGMVVHVNGSYTDGFRDYIKHRMKSFSCDEIATQLNSYNIKTPRGGKFKSYTITQLFRKKKTYTPTKQDKGLYEWKLKDIMEHPKAGHIIGLIATEISATKKVQEHKAILAKVRKKLNTILHS